MNKGNKIFSDFGLMFGSLLTLQIHSRKMNVHPDVNFEELARSTDDFNGDQLKALCVEAGMLALRRDATEVCLSPCFL